LRYCDEAKEIIGARDFQERIAAFVLSIVVQGNLVYDDYLALLRVVRSRLPQVSLNLSAFSCVILNALRWYFDYFGRRYNWSYGTIAQLKEQLSKILLETLPELDNPSRDSAKFTDAITRFYELYHQACRRLEDPFPTCSNICPSGECLFRYHNEILLEDKRLNDLFDNGMAAAAEGEGWPDDQALLQAISRLNGQSMPEIARRSIGLCYGVLQITYKPGMLETARDLAIGRLLGY